MQINDVENDFRLVACGRDGRPVERLRDLPPAIAGHCVDIAGQHDRCGYVVPWTGYVAVAGETVVGLGAFVEPPSANRVEIAYYTHPGHEGRGFAGRTARALVAIARAHDAGIEVFAKTRPEPNASTRILTRLGFEMIGMTTDHEIGDAWAWLLR